jgi:hypothetical protein
MEIVSVPKSGWLIVRLGSALARAQGARFSELAYHIVQLLFISHYMLYVKEKLGSVGSLQVILVLNYCRLILKPTSGQKFWASVLCQPKRRN